MAELRKASEILLELESEIKSLKSIVTVQDRLLKIILDNINKTNSILSILASANNLTDEQRSTIEKYFGNAAGNIVTPPMTPIVSVEKEFKGQRRVGREFSTPNTTASNSNIEFKDYMAQRSKGAQEKVSDINLTNQVVKSEKKIPVVQRVQDNNKKDLFRAEVSLVSANSEFSFKTKTNAMGKWQAQLPPGTYTVHVSKTDMATQKKIRSQQDFTINNSDKPITLPMLIINRE